MSKQLTSAFVLILLCVPSAAFSSGREGHKVIGLIAERYLKSDVKAQTIELLDDFPIDMVGSWADDYRRAHPETGPWHYIDSPLADSNLDMARDCPHGDCVVAKTRQLLAVLKDAKADRAARQEALKFVVHFVGDLHQPLHDADNGDKGGNRRYVVFDRRPDNLHWVWDTGRR